jgi:membrane-associated protein
MWHTLTDWLLHPDVHLGALAAGHGVAVYLLLFAIIFIETGVVILPFLPGDSILFVAGAFAAQGVFSLAILFPLLALAAIAGDSANYALGGVLARFVPVVRTLAPFVAALGSMAYRRFFAYNVAGGLVWVAALLGAGRAFGSVGWLAERRRA